MKRILLTLLFTILLIDFIAAQCTPDNSITEPGFYPSSLPDAVGGLPYNQVLQFKVLTDTVIDFGGNQIHGSVQSAKVNSINGMPLGFSYACNIQNCTYAGGEIGCVTIVGNPTNSMVGSYNIVVKLSFTGLLDGLPNPVTINQDVPLTMSIVQGNGIVINKNAPYFSYQRKADEIVLQNPANGKLNVRIFDVLGSSILNQNYQIAKGESTSINTSDLATGIYIVTFQMNGKQETFKFSKGGY